MAIERLDQGDMINGHYCGPLYYCGPVCLYYFYHDAILVDVVSLLVNISPSTGVPVVSCPLKNLVSSVLTPYILCYFPDSFPSI